MKFAGKYTPISNSSNENDIIKEYDVDHVINDVINQIDDIVEGADIGGNKDNFNSIIKATINSLIEKL